MARVSRLGVLFGIAVCLFLARPLRAEDGIRGHLVSVDWLAKNLQPPQVILLDASAAPLYAAQHIPGALSVDLFTYGGREVPVPEVEKRFQALGISPGKRIVIYDQGTPMMATRLFFDLYYHGFPAKDLFILDGGLSKWQQGGKEVTSAPTPAPNPGTFRITRLNAEARVKLPDVLTASGDRTHHALVEALGANWHFGELAVFDRAGHIPNGILLPSADFFNPDKTFKSAEEIQRMLAYLGIKPEQKIYTYCGGGIAASVPYFALKFLLKYPEVKLYSESEIGWLQDLRGLPYWTYDAPYLLRESNWLKTWSGQRLRMYGVSQVSVVDVRPAEAFAQGHLPFALNLPAEVFRSQLDRPERLAAILGPAGVDPSHEAVVVSGAGLTPQSALAFLLLERLGQRQVSIFLDSLETSAQRGFAPTKEATPVGPKKAPQDTSIPPAVHSAPWRTGTVTADPTATRGPYPKVFIASGRTIPASAPPGKVVHVPYSDLLDAEGRPKAAKDLWNLLVKAGVPRYAELVCFAEDPGEAAATYFILKLMGFPDAKVWLKAAPSGSGLTPPAPAP